MHLLGLTATQCQELERIAEHMRARNNEGRIYTGPDAAEANCKEANQAMTAASDRPIRDYCAQTQTRPVAEPVTLDNVDEVMRYQPWDREQLAAGDVVRETLTAAVKAVLRHVPACPTRSEVVHDLVNARMKANAAISFRGRF